MTYEADEEFAFYKRLDESVELLERLAKEHRPDMLDEVKRHRRKLDNFAQKRADEIIAANAELKQLDEEFNRLSGLILPRH